MKNIFCLFLIIGITACNKHKDDVPTYEGTLIFYKTVPTNWNLLIDSVDKGPLPFLDKAPECGSGDGLQVKLPPGTYTLFYKNMDGFASLNPKQITVDSSSCTVYRLQ